MERVRIPGSPIGSSDPNYPATANLAPASLYWDQAGQYFYADKDDPAGAFGVNRTIRTVPATGTSADAAAIQAAVTAMAGVGEVRLGPGTFLVPTSITIPSNLIVSAHPNTTLLSSVDPMALDWAACPFVQVATFSGASTTTNGAFDPDTAVNPHKITLTSAAGIVVNDTVLLSAASHHVFYGLVTNVAGNVITFDRPIARSYPSGSTAMRVATQPKSIRLYGNGALISGTGIQAMEFAGAIGCRIEGFRFDGTFTNEIAVFDNGSRDCTFADCDVRANGATVGLSSESGEGVRFLRCRVTSAAGQGIWVANGISASVEDCICNKNTGAGLVFSDQTANADHYGTRYSTVRGGDYSYNGGVGISLKSSTQGCTVEGVRASRNTSHGIEITGSAEAVSDSKTWLAPTNNKIAGVVCCYNGDSGVYLDAAKTALANVHAEHNTSSGFSLGAASSDTVGDSIHGNLNTNDGVNIVAGSLRNVFSNIVTSSNGRIGINAYGDVSIYGLIAWSNVSGAVRKDTAAKVFVSGFDVGMADGTGVYLFDIHGAGKTYLSGGTVAVGNAQGVCFAQDSTGTLFLEDISTSGASIGAYGVATTASIKLGAGVDLSSAALPIYDATTTNKIRFAAQTTEIGAITVTGANVTATWAQYRPSTIRVSGAVTGSRRNVVLPHITGHIWTIKCDTTGGFGIQAIGSSGTGVNINDGTVARVYFDGTNFVTAT